MKNMLCALILIFFTSSAVAQFRISYKEIDSIVNNINESPVFIKIIDTADIEQGKIKGRHRDYYIFDSSKTELRAIVSAIVSKKTHISNITAFYFFSNKLIKVEVYNIRTNYKKYNSTYLYYLVTNKKEGADTDENELNKIKYLRLAGLYIQYFRERIYPSFCAE